LNFIGEDGLGIEKPVSVSFDRDVYFLGSRLGWAGQTYQFIEFQTENKPDTAVGFVQRLTRR
jgi:hypothetical protein